MDALRWCCVEQTVRGQRVFVGRVQCTGDDLRKAVGPYATINSVNGECHIWGVRP